MLSEEAKERLTYAVAGDPSAVPLLAMLGPSKIVAGLIAKSNDPLDAVELLTNRAEAEQIVSGCLGMM